MTVYKAEPQEHLSLAKHLTAEVKIEEFVADKGMVVKWERIRRQNHWFDPVYNACAAGHGCSVRLVEEQMPQPPPPPPPPQRQRHGDERDNWVAPHLWRKWWPPKW